MYPSTTTVFTSTIGTADETVSIGMAGVGSNVSWVAAAAAGALVVQLTGVDLGIDASLTQRVWEGSTTIKLPHNFLFLLLRY